MQAKAGARRLINLGEKKIVSAGRCVTKNKKIPNFMCGNTE